MMQIDKAVGDTATSYTKIKSPLGELMLVANRSALTGLYFVGRDHIPALMSRWKLDPNHPMLQLVGKELQEYFAGERKSFSLPLSLAGTDFQQRVWSQIALIPYGETVSYSELAKRADAPRAIRAAGASTGRNPVSIVIPCHRVVGRDGGMQGYAGGIERKRYLLELERTTLCFNCPGGSRENSPAF